MHTASIAQPIELGLIDRLEHIALGHAFAQSGADSFRVAIERELRIDLCRTDQPGAEPPLLLSQQPPSKWSALCGPFGSAHFPQPSISRSRCTGAVVGGLGYVLPLTATARDP